MERSFWTEFQRSGAILMSTITQTYTRTDIRKLFEIFQADLQMLATRTQAMESDHARKCSDDICLMALEECLTHVHIQLRDPYGNLVKVHRFTVLKDISSGPQRPGGNGWPCLPNGSLCVLVTPSDQYKLEKLKKSGELKLSWGPSSLSTNYSGMRKDSGRLYASNSYGLQRDTFVN